MKGKSVLDQQWPQVDNEYNLDLVCVVNNQENCKIKIPRLQLDTLSETMALELLKQNPSFQKYYGEKKILKTTFDHHPGMDATLDVFIEQKKKGQAT